MLFLLALPLAPRDEEGARFLNNPVVGEREEEEVSEKKISNLSSAFPLKREKSNAKESASERERQTERKANAEAKKQTSEGVHDSQRETPRERETRAVQSSVFSLSQIRVI